MVIRLYEITNKTVSTGKRLYFFLGFFGAAIAIPVVLPNKVFKWHPGLKAGTEPIAAFQPMGARAVSYLF
jgi:hypothetical protein